MREHVDNIEVRKRQRDLNEDRVEALAESIKEIGLQTPISLYVDDDVPVLVAGHHRLAAVKKLGHKFIEAQYVDLAEIDREIWEIDENLIRAELSEMERARHTARRVELISLKLRENKIDTKQGPDTAIDQSVEEVSRKTGRGKSTVYLDLSRGTKIAEDVQDRIADHPDIADKGVELDALKSLPHDEQRQVMDRVEESGETVREAVTFITGEDPEQKAAEKRVEAAWRAFRKLTDTDRQTFFERLRQGGYLEKAA